MLGIIGENKVEINQPKIKNGRPSQTIQDQDEGVDARFEDVRNAIQSLSSPPTTHFGGGVRSYVWGRRGCTTTSGLELLPRLVAVPGDMVVWPDFSLVLVEAVAAQSGGEDVQIKISRVRISLLFDMPHAFLISLEKISRSKCKNPLSFLDTFIFISHYFPNSIVNISVLLINQKHCVYDVCILQ